MSQLLKNFRNVTCLLLLCCGAGFTQAAPPQTVNFQGRLTDLSDNPLNGSFDITFTLYNAASGGIALWTETQTGVAVDNGSVEALLGSVTPIPYSAATSPAAYLQIQVGAELLSPRQPFASVLYSMNSAQLSGRTYDMFMDLSSSQSISGTKTFGTIIATNSITAARFFGNGSNLTGIIGDSLGDHTAIADLNMSGRSIISVGTVTAYHFVGNGAGLTGISGDNLGSHMATMALNMGGYPISNAASLNVSNNVTAAKYYGDGSGLTGVSTHTFRVGDSYGGGTIFWTDNTNKQVLIAAAADYGSMVQWAPTTTATGANLDGIFAGKKNTITISTTLAVGNYAAQVCANYAVTVNNEYYDDWYLPSKTELSLLYSKKDIIGGFTPNWYWSSTESNPYDSRAWVMYFNSGAIDSSLVLAGNGYVRCIRIGPSVSVGDFSNVAADNLGNHTATQSLNMGNNAINNAASLSVYGNVNAAGFVGNGSGLTGVPGDNMGDHKATADIDMVGWSVVSVGSVTAANIVSIGSISAAYYIGNGAMLTDVPGDNLGGHTATMALNMAGFPISNAVSLTVSSNVTAGKYFGDGSGLTGVRGDNLGNHMAAMPLDMSGQDIISAGNVTAATFYGNGSNLSGISGDNLGSHTATTALNMAGFPISNAVSLTVSSNVTAGKYFGDGSALTGIAGDNLGNHTASADLNMSGRNIVSAGTVTANNFVGNGAGLTGISGDNLGSHIAGTALDMAYHQVLNVTTMTVVNAVVGGYFVGDGAGLSNLNAIAKTGGTLTGALNFSGAVPDITAVADEHITIMPSGSGNVGIGEGNPVAKLTVNGDVRTTGNLTMGVNGSATLSVGSGAGESVITAPDNQTLTLKGTREVGLGNAFQVQTYNAAKSVFADRFTVTGATDTANIAMLNSNVGIGTNNPANQFVLAHGTGVMNKVFLDGTIDDGGGAVKRVVSLSNTDGSNYGGYLALGNSYSPLTGPADGATVLLSGAPNQNSYISVGNVGIGTTTPDAKLHIAGGVKIVDGTQGAGKVLTSDSSGLASWQPSAGDNLGSHLATQNLDMNSLPIVNVATITAAGLMTLNGPVTFNDGARVIGNLRADSFTGDGSGLSGINAPGDNLGSHTASAQINLSGFPIVNVSSIVMSEYGLSISTTNGGVFFGGDGSIYTLGLGNGTYIPNARGIGSVDLQTRRVLGMDNVAAGNYSTIAGGESNKVLAAADHAFIGGGDRNAVTAGQNGVVSGGYLNTLGGSHGFIGGGYGNTAGGGAYALVTGGKDNVAASQYSAVHGGYYNRVNDIFSEGSMVPGGANLTVTNSKYALAAGYWAAVNNADGSFTWNDYHNTGGNSELVNNVPQRTLFKNRGGFLITGSTNTTMSGMVDRGMFVSGNGLVGIAINNPQAALDVVSFANGYAQIWRDTSGNVVSSMSAAGVLYPQSAPVGDNLGSHIAGTALDMSGFPISNVENLYVTGSVSAASFSGDGSGLTGINPPGDNLGNHTAMQDLGMGGFGISSVGNITGSGAVALTAGGIGALDLLAGNTLTPGQTGGAVKIAAGGGYNAPGAGVRMSAGLTSTWSAAGSSAAVVLDGGPSDSPATSAQVKVHGKISSGSGMEYNPGGPVEILGGNGNAAQGGNIILMPGLGSPAGNVGVGTANPGAKLEVVGNVKITDGTQGAGKVLTSDSSGLASWQAAGGDNLGDHTATQQLKMGNYAVISSSDISATRYQINGGTVLAILPGAGSLGVGVNAGRVNTGAGNTFVGNQAGYANTTGTGNTFMGVDAGLANTTANGGTFIGIEAGYANTTGAPNTFVGDQAGRYNTTGMLNSFMGYQAGYVNTTGGHNSFLGVYAGVNNTTGEGNSVVGVYAAQHNQAGSANAIFGGWAGGYGSGGVNSFSSSTLMGYRAGYGLSTGSDNILLGFQAGDNLNTGSRNIIIGYDQNATAPTISNELNIGGIIWGNLQTGAVGLGLTTTLPQAALDVKSTGTAADQMAQVWRNSGGTVVSSVSATGVVTAAKFVGDGSGLTGVGGADNLGNHTATTNLNMGGFAINSAGDINGAAAIKMEAGGIGALSLLAGNTLTPGQTGGAVTMAAGGGYNAPGAGVKISAGLTSTWAAVNSSAAVVLDGGPSDSPSTSAQIKVHGKISAGSGSPTNPGGPIELLGGNGNSAPGGNIILMPGAGSTAGSVGIGTYSPGTTLHVLSQSNNIATFASPSGVSSVLTIQNDAVTEQRTMINFNSWSSGNSGLRSMGNIGFVPGGHISIETSNNGNTGGERLRITATGDIGVGTSNPGAKLEVAGNVKIADGTQGAGKVLTSDSSGLASWQTVAGDNLGDHTASMPLKMGAYSVQTSSDITAAVYEINGSTILAQRGTTYMTGLAIGKEAAPVSTADNGIFIGYKAGYKNTNGTQNLALGYEAAHENTGGNYNVSIGFGAGFTNASSHNNLNIGVGAGYGNIGTSNVFLGNAAAYNNGAGNYNVAVGVDAIRYGLTSANNAVVGYQAGAGQYPYTSFSNAALLGYQAGNQLWTGSNNTLLGYKAGYSLQDGANNIVIGANQDASYNNASNELNIGGVLFGNLATKMVGISTRAPQAALDVAASTSVAGSMVQIWRDSGGTIVSSVSATGVVTASKFVSQMGGSTGQSTAVGFVGVNFNTQATIGTSEEVISSYVLPANSLNVNGKGLRIKVWGTKNNVCCAAKTLRLRIGGITGTILADSITDGDGGGTSSPWFYNLNVFRTAQNVQKTLIERYVYGTPGAYLPKVVSSTLDDSAPIDIVVTGETANPGEITAEGMIVEFVN